MVNIISPGSKNVPMKYLINEKKNDTNALDRALLSLDSVCIIMKSD